MGCGYMEVLLRRCEDSWPNRAFNSRTTMHKLKDVKTKKLVEQKGMKKEVTRKEKNNKKWYKTTQSRKI